MGDDAHRTPARRFDPQRRDRIIDACLDVVGEVGVAGASHRRIAAAAGVPLGSMTYHFDGMDALLREAFDRFAHTVSARFEATMAAAAGADEAAQAVVDLITTGALAEPRELVLTHELYTLAARDPRFREITHAWMGRSRRALERHVDPATARVLDALVEGLTIHRALDTDPAAAADVSRAVALVMAGRTTPGVGPVDLRGGGRRA